MVEADRETAPTRCQVGIGARTAELPAGSSAVVSCVRGPVSSCTACFVLFLYRICICVFVLGRLMRIFSCPLPVSVCCS